MISAAPRAPAAQAVMEARGLTRVYRMGAVEVPALRDVDLDRYPGELAVLPGASGSGKSTPLNLLGGLDVPTGGTIRFCGHDLTSAGDRELTRFRREHVGFVFQFYNLIPVAPGTPLVELGDANALEVRVDVLSANAVRIAPGMPLLVEEWGGDGVLRGRVRTVSPHRLARWCARTRAPP